MTVREQALAFALVILFLVGPTSQNAHAQRMTIDEELLSSMVQAKQEEIKARWFAQLIRGTIATTNYTTYNTLYDCVDILTTEKNSSVMTKHLVMKAADYGLAFAAATVILSTGDSSQFEPPQAKETRVFFMDATHQRELGAKALKAGASEIVERGYVMDMVYELLGDRSELRQRGLFRAYKDRTWDWKGLEPDNVYKKYFDANSGRQAELDKKVTDFMKKVGDVDKLIDELNTVWSEINKKEGWRFTTAATFDVPDLLQLSKDDAGTIAMAMTLFRAAGRYFGEGFSQNALIDQMVELITTYVIFDPEFDTGSTYGFQVDVEGIILAFEDRFMGWNMTPTKNCWLNIRPFFVIGLNYGYFGGPDTTFTAESSLGQRQIAWAGEKIGIRWRIWDWGYTRTQPLGQPFKYHGSYYTRNVRPKMPLVTNIHMLAYASGVLYTIADLRSDASFNSIIGGLGLGIQFFNKMELNASYALPVDAPGIESGFWNIGFDIPIFEYIREARAKKAGT